MPDLNDLFDSYERKARLFPGLLLTLPIGVALVVLLPGFDPRNLLALVVAAGVSIFIANAVRSRGKHLERQLVDRWGGMPTTRMLRHAGPTDNEQLLQRRRRKLEALTGEALPTPEEEAADPSAADKHYIAATKSLITRVRETKEHFHLVDVELTSYGFRRNLAGLKPIGITLAILLLGIDVGALVMDADPTKVVIAAAIHLGCMIAWLVTVRERWVREQAESYAERLFETLEEPALTSPPPAPA